MPPLPRLPSVVNERGKRSRGGILGAEEIRTRRGELRENEQVCGSVGCVLLYYVYIGSAGRLKYHRLRKYLYYSMHAFSIFVGTSLRAQIFSHAVYLGGPPIKINFRSPTLINRGNPIHFYIWAFFWPACKNKGGICENGFVVLSLTA